MPRGVSEHASLCLCITFICCFSGGASCAHAGARHNYGSAVAPTEHSQQRSRGPGRSQQLLHASADTTPVSQPRHSQPTAVIAGIGFTEAADQSASRWQEIGGEPSDLTGGRDAHSRGQRSGGPASRQLQQESWTRSKGEGGKSRRGEAKPDAEARNDAVVAARKPREPRDVSRLAPEGKGPGKAVSGGGAAGGSGDGSAGSTSRAQHTGSGKQKAAQKSENIPGKVPAGPRVQGAPVVGAPQKRSGEEGQSQAQVSGGGSNSSRSSSGSNSTRDGSNSSRGVGNGSRGVGKDGGGSGSNRTRTGGAKPRAGASSKGGGGAGSKGAGKGSAGGVGKATNRASAGTDAGGEPPPAALEASPASSQGWATPEFPTVLKTCVLASDSSNCHALSSRICGSAGQCPKALTR